MKLVATQASVDAGIPSALAFVECLVAVLIYSLICLHLGTLLPYSLAIAAAPLLLLRTTRSTEMALRHYTWLMQRLTNSLDRLPSYRIRDVPFPRKLTVLAIALVVWIASVIVLSAYIPISALSCRIGTTIWCALRFPLESLKSIPANWYRQALCTDLTIAPELLPGESQHAEFLPRFHDLIQGIRDEARERSWVFTFPFLIPLLVIGYVPVLLLRLSFKASSFAYLPLVWVTHASLNTGKPISFRLERIVSSHLENVRRLVSVLVAGATLMKLAFAAGLITPEVMKEKEKDVFAGQALVNMSDWPPWQIFLLIEAALTFFLWFFADAALARIKHDVPWPAQTVKHVFELATFVRAALGIVTVAIFLVSAVVHVALAVRSTAAHGGFQGILT